MKAKRSLSFNKGVFHKCVSVHSAAQKLGVYAVLLFYTLSVFFAHEVVLNSSFRPCLMSAAFSCILNVELILCLSYLICFF